MILAILLLSAITGGVALGTILRDALDYLARLPNTDRALRNLRRALRPRIAGPAVIEADIQDLRRRVAHLEARALVKTPPPHLPRG